MVATDLFYHYDYYQLVVIAIINHWDQFKTGLKRYKKNGNIH